jgi:hypothetical protein
VDIVYICREGDNEELRYSIRSAVKNLPHDNLWVVGGKPDWYKGPYIPTVQDKAYFINAKNNIRKILHSDKISDSFILMNDDFFVMNKVNSLPYMYSGLLLDKISLRENYSQGDLYTRMLLKTYSELYQRSKIKQPLDYELHVPMIFEKEKLSSVIGSQGLWRSMYGNIHKVGGEEFKDVKIYNKDHVLSNNFVDINSSYLSTEDKAFQDHKEWFNEKFSKPSKFEH